MTTSTAYLKIEVEAHSALATAGRIVAVLSDAGTIVTRLAYVPYQAFRIWRKMNSVASLIEGRHELLEQQPAKPVSQEEVEHAVTLLRELHGAVSVVTHAARQGPTPLRMAYGPFLGAIERATSILEAFLGDVEMSLSPEFRTSLQTAIAELKPPSGTDWRDSLGAMRN